MLLLLRSPPSGSPAAIAAISFGLVAAGNTGITQLSTSFGINLTSVEISISANVGFANKLTGISVGFLSGPATAINTAFDLPASGGFGGATQLTTVFGLTGTVGSTLQGIGAPDITLGLNASPLIAITGKPGIVFALAGTPITSGGTVTPTAVTNFTFSLNGTPSQTTSAVCDMALGLKGTAITSVPNLATDMRLSFECDEIRVFFRKG
jgi:hypothetical protein